MIEIRNVSKVYGAQSAVDDVSLAIPKGTVFGFLGPNGAGKTTTIKMIVGLLIPDRGSITVGGKSFTDILMREKIGFMPEAPYFYERLTGLEFMEFCGQLFPHGKHTTRAEHEKILKETGIYDARHKPIRNYSKGMKQRLAFSQALVNDPEYVFLDEPLDGLDPIGRREIKIIIKNLHAAGKTVFFNSHILYDAEELCDMVGVIDYGKLLYVGSTKKFCSNDSLEKKFIETIERHRALKQ